MTGAALAAREAAGLPADLSATGRWRWLQREAQRPGVPGPRRSAEDDGAPAHLHPGRHRGH